MPKRPILKRILAVGAATFLLLQAWPVERSNPAVGAAALHAPPEVDLVLRAACYDCHSNETKWPWYSYIAPISWQVAHHVEEGRAQLNFSEWGSYRESKQLSLAEEMIEQIDEGEMPTWDYELAHPEARLDPSQVEVLRRWVDEL
jgi:hypothetical protein